MADTALPIDPESPSIAEDIRRKIAEKAAVKRGTEWENMGCPCSEPHMAAEKYRKEYRGRIWCASKAVFEGIQQALKIIICPKCIKEESYGAIEGTRFYTSVEDDVMTVFPAVGHFVCHNCGFEEWHPLKSDPRAQAEADRNKAFVSMLQQAQAAQQQAGMSNLYGGVLAGQAQARGLGGAMMGSLSDYQAALKNSLAQQAADGINPGMGPIYGMTQQEQESLYRLYQRQQKEKMAPPPAIVESREEAEMLLKLAPTERRQSIIQKLRDKGYL